MIRKIIEINEELCNGCGICVDACHEGALQMVDGKAKLISDHYCDGLGDCLPACPTGAITIIERKADAFDEEAVAIRMKEIADAKAAGLPPPNLPISTPDTAKPSLPCGCPGTMAKAITRPTATPATPCSTQDIRNTGTQENQNTGTPELRNWPVQIKLMPVNAPYLHNAALLIAADCTAFAYPDIHSRFMRNKVTLIGCPKLDEGDYAEKLTAVLTNNEIRSVTVLRMEVPCCAGIASAVQRALVASGKMIPWQIVTIRTDGTIVDD